MINKGQVLGRVGKIETKTMTTGLKVSNISIVTSKKYTQNGEKKEKVTWHNVTAFSKLAEICEAYVQVGDLLYVEGDMDTQKYTGKDGQEKSKHVILASEVKLIPKATQSSKTKPQQTDLHMDENFLDDDVPF